MTYKGTAKGKTIELEEPLPFLDGQVVAVSVEPLNELVRPGSPSAVLRAMDASPHLQPDVVDELVRSIAAGKLAVRSQGVFDS